MILNIFYLLACHVYILFHEMSVQVFGPFFNWVVHFLIVVKTFLCILINSSLLDMTFANIFFQSIACILIFLILYLIEQKFLIFMKSSFVKSSPASSVHSYMDCAFGVVYKMSLH